MFPQYGFADVGHVEPCLAENSVVSLNVIHSFQELPFSPVSFLVLLPFDQARFAKLDLTTTLFKTFSDAPALSLLTGVRRFVSLI